LTVVGGESKLFGFIGGLECAASDRAGSAGDGSKYIRAPVIGSACAARPRASASGIGVPASIGGSRKRQRSGDIGCGSGFGSIPVAKPAVRKD
jgi:hypothetical protein